MATGSWKKTFNTVNIKQRSDKQSSSTTKNAYSSSSAIDNNVSWLPQFYHGSADRINRYKQYDYMDFDVDVNMALDKTAEFCTLIDETTGLPFILKINKDVTTSDAEILRHMLDKWCRINDWNGRLFEMFRSTLKYGDQMFIRDPDTFVLNWVDMYNVSRVLVNEEFGKDPEYCFIRNVDFNLKEKVATEQSNYISSLTLTSGGMTPTVGGSFSTKNSTSYGFNTDGYTNPYSLGNNGQIDEEYPVSYSHIVHVSRSQGMDNVWPFGRSILDPVFKPFRQKELMEEAIIIYRVQRSPERLVFKIDTGDMNAKKAKEYLNEVKKEYKQKRVPVVDAGSGQTIMDTTYSPLSMTEDFFLAQGMDGRGSTIETLPGGECLTLDTEIRLYNGEVDTLENIIARYQNGEQMWVYSVDPVTEVVIPAMVSWAGVTREDTEVIRLDFNDGSHVKVTPDHKFPIRGKGFVEAKDILPTDELLHVDFKYENHQNKYYNTQTNQWEDSIGAFESFFNKTAFKIKFPDVYDGIVPFSESQKRSKVMVTKITPIPNLDTGTITVDGKEYYTDNHTFALANGIFTKNSTGSIEDLKFFASRLIRALRVPVSYMSYLTEDGNSYTYNDGKNGTAYMEEFSYSEYCKRLQRQIIKPLNREFKLFVKSNGVEISASEFDITFVPPQSFSEYRQIELDTAQMGVFQSISDVSYLSNRFKLKRFMGLTESEIKENEKLWMEEKKIRFNVSDSTLNDANISVPSDGEIEDLELDETELDSSDNDNESTEDLDFFGDDSE